MPKNKKTHQRTNVTWAQAVRDITVRAMDRGQLLPVGFFIAALLFIFKLPEDKVYPIMSEILSGFKSLALLGWLVAAIIAILWAGHARTMRRNHSAEYKRIGMEKSNLQHEQSKMQLTSSDNK